MKDDIQKCYVCKKELEERRHSYRYGWSLCRKCRDEKQKERGIAYRQTSSYKKRIAKYVPPKKEVKKLKFHYPSIK